MVSHDRAFLDNVVTRIMGMDGKGAVRECVGSYTDYIDVVKSEQAAVVAAKKAKSPKAKAGKRLGFNENNELKKLPARIEKLETEQAGLHDKMIGPDYYKAAPEEIAADKRRADDLVEELMKVYDRWEELEALRNG